MQYGTTYAKKKFTDIATFKLKRKEKKLNTQYVTCHLSPTYIFLLFMKNT